nr:MAG TPA: hypothetical protein [Caudoviricetes sp.]
MTQDPGIPPGSFSYRKHDTPHTIQSHTRDIIKISASRKD